MSSARVNFTSFLHFVVSTCSSFMFLVCFTKLLRHQKLLRTKNFYVSIFFQRQIWASNFAPNISGNFSFKHQHYVIIKYGHKIQRIVLSYGSKLIKLLFFCAKYWRQIWLSNFLPNLCANFCKVSVMLKVMVQG